MCPFSLQCGLLWQCCDTGQVPLSPPHCFTAWEVFTLFFPKCVFLFGYFFFPTWSASPIILKKMTTVRPTVFKTAKMLMKLFSLSLISTAVSCGPFYTVWAHFPMCHLGQGGLRITPRHLKSLHARADCCYGEALMVYRQNSPRHPLHKG